MSRTIMTVIGIVVSLVAFFIMIGLVIQLIR